MRLSVENPKTKILTFGEHRRVLEKAKKHPKKFQDLVFMKITQPESQKLVRVKRIKNIRLDQIPQSDRQKLLGIVSNGIMLRGIIRTEGPIERIVKILDEYGELNTSQIKYKTGLSWASVIRTLRLFIDRNVVKMKTRKDRRNNEKIYSLKRDRAIFYVSWLQSQKYPLFSKDVRKSLKYATVLEKEYTQGLEQHEINLSEKAQKEFGVDRSRIKIHDLPYGTASILMVNYSNGFYCFDCFEKGNVTELKRIEDDMSVCPLCGKETPYHDITTRHESLKGRLWDIEKEIHKIKNKHNKKT